MSLRGTATRGELVNYASLPLIFMGGWAGYALYEGAGAIILLGSPKFSRHLNPKRTYWGFNMYPNSDERPTLKRRDQ